MQCNTFLLPRKINACFRHGTHSAQIIKKLCVHVRRISLYTLYSTYHTLRLNLDIFHVNCYANQIISLCFSGNGIKDLALIVLHYSHNKKSSSTEPRMYSRTQQHPEIIHENVVLGEQN